MNFLHCIYNFPRFVFIISRVHTITNFYHTVAVTYYRSAGFALRLYMENINNKIGIDK